MKYILKTIQGDKIIITDKEYKSYLSDKSDVVFFKDKSITIKKSMVAIIYPESQSSFLEAKKKQQIGVLHDGQLVRRHFGQWVLYDETYPDDNGNYSPVVVDSSFYPEIARDCVPTQEEFEKMEHLSYEKRLELIIGDHEKLIGKRTGEIKQIGEVCKRLK